MNKQTKVWLVLSIALSLLAISSSCGGTKTGEGPAANTNGGGATAEKWTGGTGTISGVVSFNGTPPAPRKIDTAADPVCGQKNPNLVTDDTLVKDGKLANVFVYVKEGTVEGGKKLADYTWDTPTSEVQLDQNGCHYAPHVLGIQVGQPLQIVNSDDTLHNVHGLPMVNKEFNQGQPIQGMKMTHTFSTKEVMVPFKCDVHGWMNAWIGVVDHPYYAVTSTDGSFSLKGLPPGTYTIEAWHEKLGTQTQTVTVGEKETKDIAFAFKA